MKIIILLLILVIICLVDGTDKSCKDLNKKCSKWTELCRETKWVAWMTTNCAKTCEYCVSACEDTYKQCRKSLCKINAAWKIYAKANCRKTCGYCVSIKLIEGDIVLDATTKRIVYGKTSGYAYDAMTSRVWPGGVVPYYFDSNFGSSGRNAVLRAIAYYKKKTCVKFRPWKTGDKNYARFYNGGRGRCFSYIGMQRGRQDISIGSGCENSIGVVIHEMMHAIGFFHEQSRRDRDKYITIYWNNIIQKNKFNFKMYDHGQASTLRFPYDLSSIMHYDRYAFSRNRQPTILAKGNPRRKLGQRTGFTQIDMDQINTLYKCKSTTRPTGCKDKHNKCYEFKSKKYCQETKNGWKAWMKTYCAKACGYCGGTKPGSNCKNKYKQCSKYRSYCKTTTSGWKKWMTSNCAKYCGYCGTSGPVNGGYGPWSGYGSCSKKCDGGTKKRTRKCNNPSPKRGGRNCSRLGGSYQTISCNTHRCPKVNGGYGPWSAYGSCSKKCDGGTKKRTRKCNNPSPGPGGRGCSGLGAPSQTIRCNTHTCTTGPSSCVDKYQRCYIFKENNLCKKYVSYMKSDCKKTCQYCAPPPVPPQPKPGSG